MLISASTSPFRQPIILLVGLAVFIKLAFISWINHLPMKTDRREHTYIADDYPMSWDIDLGRPVVMLFEPSRHYNPDTREGYVEWEEMTPGNGLIYLGKEKKPFSISMFHQLRCLGVIRKHVVNATIPSMDSPFDELLHHCFNYIRQMVLCRADITLEQAYAPPNVIKNNAQICNNWERVYEEVGRNHNST